MRTAKTMPGKIQTGMFVIEYQNIRSQREDEK